MGGLPAQVLKRQLPSHFGRLTLLILHPDIDALDGDGDHVGEEEIAEVVLSDLEEFALADVGITACPSDKGRKAKLKGVDEGQVVMTRRTKVNGREEEDAA